MKQYVFFAACLFLFILKTAAQQVAYSDGRPAATKRIACEDAGIVMRYGDGPDSCDFLGAREAIINKEKGVYHLFYDGAGKTGWLACLAVSKDLENWEKKGALLSLGAKGTSDAGSASSPWVIKQGSIWHMFYLGTPNTTPAPARIPAFPYLTMKATATSLKGPWIKHYDVTPFTTKKGTFYATTASPGYIVKYKGIYVQFFSGSMVDTANNNTVKRTLGIATTTDLNGSWQIRNNPVVPLEEQVENSSLYFDEKTSTWYLFTNHIGITAGPDKTEYTDAVWVYWSKDIYNWDAANKAVVLDSSNCTWSKGAIGMPSVIKIGNRLAMLYDAFEGFSSYHMKRNIGLAWITLPIQIDGNTKPAVVKQ